MFVQARVLHKTVSPKTTPSSRHKQYLSNSSTTDGIRPKVKIFGRGHPCNTEFYCNYQSELVVINSAMERDVSPRIRFFNLMLFVRNKDFSLTTDFTVQENERKNPRGQFLSSVLRTNIDLLIEPLRKDKTSSWIKLPVHASSPSGDKTGVQFNR